MRVANRLRHRATNRGQSVIEFALVLPILLLVVFGITEFGRALLTVNILNAAAREGARVAAISGDSTSAVSSVVAVLQAGRVKNWAISVAGPDASRAITVTVDTQFNVLSAKVLPMRGTITLRGRTVMRFEG
jgi:Flp pilus assembly protein TadG